MSIGDNKDYIRVLLDSYYTTITGERGPPKASPSATKPASPGETFSASFVRRVVGLRV